MMIETEAKNSEEFSKVILEAGKQRSATFVFINDTDHDVTDLNHGWEYRSGGGLITLGATCYKHEQYRKTTSYGSGCMLRVVFNFKINGRLFERQSKDAPPGKCYGRYTFRIYTRKPLDGKEETAEQVIWEEVFEE